MPIPTSLAARAAILALVLTLSGCAYTAKLKPDPRDPWEPFNRTVFRANDAIDRSFAKPLAKGYRAVTPRVVRTGVSNFFDNLGYPTTIFNAALQGKGRQAGRHTARFLLNTTLGLAGIFDPASPAGFEKNDEDFGQTLGKWGVPAGPYLVLPLFGPSTVRDSFGRVVDRGTDPSSYVDDTATTVSVNLVQLVDGRARLLDLERQLDGVFDRYAFIRNAWLPRREYQVRDGDVVAAPPEDDMLQDAPEEDTSGGPAPQTAPPDDGEPPAPPPN
jgi:phospholipid-binding lipoprotein MlaA